MLFRTRNKEISKLETQIQALTKRIEQLERGTTLCVDRFSDMQFSCLPQPNRYMDKPLKSAVLGILNHLGLELKVIPASTEYVTLQKKETLGGLGNS